MAHTKTRELSEPSSPAPAETERRGTSPLVRTGGVLAAMAAVGLVAGACSSDDDSASTTTETPAATADAGAGAESSGPGAGSGEYADGEYTARGEYDSPGGRQSVGVTLTLSNSVIAGVTIDTSQTKGPSVEYQGKFKSGIADVIVGKNIDEIDVDKVSGSSLTSGGFNEAVEEIKQEAQA